MSREMKDSGIEWIGDIPTGWKICQIRRVMRNRSERNQPNAEVLSLYRDWGIVPKKSRDDNHNVTSEDTTNYKVVHKGDFVINKMKAWQGSMAVSDYDGIISPAYYVCKFVNNHVYKRYIHHLLRNESYKNEYMRLSRGLRVGQWDLNIESFLRVNMVLPPLAEQQKIADYLDKVCGEIDDMIALQEKMIEELKAYKQSVITEAVTKGLNPNVPMRDSGIDWIGEIPEHWKIVKIKNISQTNSGSTPKLNRTNDENANLIWVRTTDLNNNIVTDSSEKLTEDEFKSASCPMLEKDTLLVAMYGGAGTIGKCGLLGVDATINQALCSMTFNREQFPKYMLYFIISIKKYWMKYAASTRKDPNISQEIVRNMSVVIPQLTEQQAIADFLDKKCADIDALIAIKQEKIDALKEYKKSLIYEYVTGKKEIN